MANNNQINNEYLNNYSNNGTIYSATSIDLSTNQQITEKNVTLLDYDNPILKNGAQISADGYDAYSPLELNKVCRLGLTAFSKIFDFVKNVWSPITQQKKFIKSKQDRKQNVSKK